ncbi:hypothetical protein BC834DRAFT_965318 [Gloeopeniophorella convolvens]|nr:hypothetical protein BC834DRAFT_965318 [Gloeopeniophorella convolvens]
MPADSLPQPHESPKPDHAVLNAAPLPRSMDAHRPSTPLTPPASYTDAKPSSLKVKKRIIVCCDGTWQDGVVVTERWKYTNILRFSRAINHVDERFVPPRPQIVFYQSGVGSEPNRYYALLDGATGASLGDKVQEAYAFIAHNYEPGDDIYLFGFSRGAYTARMVAMMIGEIGVLDRTEMDHFAGIFVDFQARGKATDKAQIEALDRKLAPWTSHTSPGKIRADYDGDSFAIKCVGVFDTVGSLGLPEELALGSKKIKTLFGFPDSILGVHIERAYQALALNETRADFDCNKFQLSEEGRRKKQVLKQCWFAGCHSDIGGGYKEHDLSDLTLFWMAANVEDVISIDTRYLFSLIKPVAPWGTQEPHDPKTGIFVLANTIHRQLPTSFSPITHETIHPSVLTQDTIPPQLKTTLAAHPDLIIPLLPLEDQLKRQWHYVPSNEKSGVATVTETKLEADIQLVRRGSVIVRTFRSLRRRAKGDDGTISPQTVGTFAGRRDSAILTVNPDDKSWLSRLAQETSIGAFVRDLM